MQDGWTDARGETVRADTGSINASEGAEVDNR